MEFWLLIVIAGVIIWVIYYLWSESQKAKELANQKLDKLQHEVNQVIEYREDLNRKLTQIEQGNKQLQKYENDLNELVRQRSKGFPLLGEVYAEYIDVQGKKSSAWLRNKKRPAVKAADEVREVTKEKRELIKQLKILEFKLKNYELIAPFLIETADEITEEDDAWLLRDYTNEELEDETIKFLTKEEYRKLPTAEKNQLALDRYWSRGKKSLWAIGKMYEHYIGYLYEEQGWDVEYFGIAQRYEDFGRDLIAIKANKVHIVQCKNWSKYKTIYENHIFQLFGTTFEYQKQHPELKVTPVFYTTTNLSESASEFAKRLGIEINIRKLERYPCIRCNISRKDGTKIYHLPFDQQYDTSIIEPSRGEFYAMTVAEAEQKGFRRAFRWHPEKKD